MVTGLGIRYSVMCRVSYRIFLWGHVVLCRWLHDEGNYKGSKLPLQEVLHV